MNPPAGRVKVRELFRVFDTGGILTMRGLLFDLDGVFYQNDAAVAGAAETLDWVAVHGIPHLFITNTTSKPRSAITDKLAALGMCVSPDQILSPPVAAAHWLAAHTTEPVALFLPGATQSEFDGLTGWSGDEQERVGAVVLGDLADEWSFTRLNQAFRLLMQTPPPALIALGMTRYWRTAAGLQLDVGPFVKALEYASGVEPVVLGKPSAAFFHAATGLIGLNPDAVLMVGDDLHGDIGGAQQAGLAGALVRTGKFRPEDLAGAIRPDATLGSIADLPGWWERHATA